MWSLKTWLEWLFDDPEQSIPYRLDLVYDRVDDWLLEKRFEKADEIFELLQEELFDQALSCLALTVGFLTVTNGAQEHLQKREEFVSQLQNALIEREGKERADALLSGLE